MGAGEILKRVCCMLSCGGAGRGGAFCTKPTRTSILDCGCCLQKQAVQPKGSVLYKINLKLVNESKRLKCTVSRRLVLK